MAERRRRAAGVGERAGRAGTGFSGPLSNVNNYRPRFIELDLRPGGSGGEAPFGSPPPHGEAPDAEAEPAIGSMASP